ncbi:hypothetical protein [Phormidesmis sp. 146-33]
MMDEKPKGLAYYLGRSLQVIGFTVCLLAMFKFATLFVEFAEHFGDFSNFEQQARKFSEMASVFPQFLIGGAIAAMGGGLTYERDAALLAGKTNITAKNIISAGGHVSNIAGDDISGQVMNSITQLHVSRNPDARQLADLLYQLQTAIEADRSLGTVDKTDALEQVKALSQAGKDSQIAKTAIRTLKSMMTELPTAVTFLEACSKLLPMISGLFGLRI